MRYAKVVVGLPVEGPFSYLIPQRLDKVIGKGMRVIVPFGRQKLTGYVVGFTSVSPQKKKLKAIEEVLNGKPVIGEDLLKLTRWIADYYFCAWGEAIEAVIPPILRKGKVKIKSSDLAHKPTINSSLAAIEPSSFRGAEEGQDFAGRGSGLSVLEKRASKRIKEALAQNKKRTFLIQRIPNRDRLNIYFEAIEFNLKSGNSSIILIPEISLISPIEERLRLKFGAGQVALIHSRLSRTRLYCEWKKIKERKSAVVIGSRSAIFAPVKNLKLIIVDDEEDSSYKQMEVPRYNVREVALKRAGLSRAVVILGGMAPSVESYSLANTKECELIASTPQNDAPELKIIDMRREPRRKQKKKVLISGILESAIKEALSQKEKVILFLNRRGFATFIHCPKCKTVLRCKNCNIALKHHFKEHLAICHRCRYQIPAPEICPGCNASYVHYAGSGTQKLESELNRLFPSARILRIDSDTLCKEISSRYKEVDILIGTKAISKISFNPSPQLIGIISLDALLNVPDFRGSERAFQLLTHFTNLVKRSGSLVIQTYFPENSILKFVSKGEYSEFYGEELKSRRDLNLPPFKHIALLNLRGKNETILIQGAQRLVASLVEKKPQGMDIIGPIPAPLSKLRGNYQQNIIIKAKSVFSVNRFLKENLGGFTRSRMGNIPLTVDVDPI